jgi:hypothetical protein
MTEVFFEVVPPSKMSSQKHREKVLDKIASAINSVKIDCINIPEVIEENHLGKPYYRNLSVRWFAKELQALTGKNVVVNKGVVYFNGMQQFLLWVKETVNEFKVKDFVFVGGKTANIAYSGPSVIQANREAKKINGIRIGNICIPSREKEAERMLNKTLSGANFFTSQVLFESNEMKNLLLEYEALCKEKKVQPSKIFLSFCPVSRMEEVSFLKWLGVNIPPETENELKKETPLSSINITEKVWTEINEFKRDMALSVPLGLNVEEIFLHNLDFAVDIALKLTNNLP